VLAHRGLRRRHPENTLGAFEDAVAQGVDGIETDVRLTSDGRLVLHHDRILPDGRPLAELTLAELERARAPLAPPTVEEALAAFPDLLWNLEVKAAAALPPLLALLRGHRSRSRVVLSSFDHAALHEHAAGQGLRLGALVAHRPATPDAGDAQGRSGVPSSFDLVVWAFETLDPALVARLGAGGTRSWVYDPQTAAEHASLARLGLEAVITDHPARATCLRDA
jgi:glycerophosphoryl diester phosphodiesterase